MPSTSGSILQLCRVLADTPAMRAQTIGELSSAADRAALIALAGAERVLPALYEALRPFPDSLSKSERVELALAHEANRRKNLLIRDAVIEIAGEADRHSMEVVALKGARWIIEDTGGLAAWRSMLDIDLLVRVENHSAMRGILEHLGYRSTRRERNFLGQSRFAGHYHLVALRRGNQPFSTEMHRHIGWQPDLLPTELIFAASRAVAPGLRLPCPWHAALHAIIHLQIHHYGYQLGFHRVADGLDISKFLGRDDVDWAAATAHAARVGIEREFAAAIATVTELFGAPAPPGFRASESTRNFFAKALLPRESRLAAWQAKQHQRIIRLWHDHRFLYRANLREAGPVATRIGLWALRVRRLPFLISHLASITLLQAAISFRQAFQRRR